ncbi:MAG: membrane protein insertion efficiency factor YidD [Verrucomicrobiota bacterium]|nr:membrane protein insertion efficiency factor YidD [Verrucomicrobiota bacterium]
MNPLQHLLLALLRVYRWVGSPMKRFLLGPGSGCRFVPTCSVYAQEAIGRHGAGRGSILSLGRLCRCHPWGGCGEDPVPPSPSSPGPGPSAQAPLPGVASARIRPVACP